MLVQPTCAPVGRASHLGTTVVEPARPTVSRPPRLNFAGCCNVCLDYGCQQPDCAAIWEKIIWIACPDCRGTKYQDIDTGPDPCVSCDCFYGVREVSPEAPAKVTLVRTGWRPLDGDAVAGDCAPVVYTPGLVA